MKTKGLLCALLGAFVLQGVAVRADLPPLIPREVLFGNPDKASPQISPDGKQLAYLAPDAGVLNVWVRTIGKTDDRPITKDRHRGIRMFFWAENNDQILYIQDKNGDENWHVYAVEMATRNVRDLTPYDNVQARILAVERRFPNQILVGLNRRDPQLHDVYKADLNSGELTLAAQNTESFVGWQADHNFKVRGGLKITPNGGFEMLVREDPASAWRTLATWGPKDTLNSGPVAFTPDNQGLYLLSSVGANASELREINIRTGKEKTLASDRKYDVSGILMHPVKHIPQAVSFTRDRAEWEVLDDDVKKDFRTIARIKRGDFNILNRDHADRNWLVAFTMDDGPVHYYKYDRETKDAVLLFTSRKALENVKLAQMEPIKFEARDGMTIHGYLTKPVGIKAKDLPMVLNVHGGPWARDTWGYNGEAQWLANRGYAVLQVNFRGSTGYGKDFVNAANREWAGEMHDDLIDAVKWATKEGIADPKRVAIFGGSYGGYATLVGLTFTPDVFACGVDIVGPSNLVTWMETIPPYWKPIEPLFWDRVGHPEKDAALLKERSPIHRIDRITKPLLIAQGRNDPRVKVSESLQIVDALQKAGKTVEYVEYPDEGHGFARPENRLDFYQKAEKFLAAHIGGRYEP